MIASLACASRSGWPLERVLFALAGMLTLLGALVVAAVSSWFWVLTGFVGVNQWLFVVFGACPASWILGRVFGLTARRIRTSEGGLR
jgi:hypothetical protein